MAGGLDEVRRDTNVHALRRVRPAEDEVLDPREQQALDCLLRHGLIDLGERRRAAATAEPRRIGGRGA